MGMGVALIIGLIFGLAFYGGSFFWIYWCLRLRLTSMARGKHRGRPVMLFILGLLGFLVAVVLIYALVWSISVAAGSTALTIVFVLVFLVAGGGGAIGWIVLGIKGFRDREARRRFDAQHPLPKLQLYMQDLILTAFFFALYMGFQQGFGSRIQANAEYVIALSAWVMLCIACGLYFALDICRRSLRLQAPRPRFFFLFGVLLVTTITVLVPAWLTWRAWRYALWQAGWVLGRDLEEKRSADRLNAGAVE